MRSLQIATVLALSACAVISPKPTIWQIESECADSQPFTSIEDCTRDGLTEQYGEAWHSTPAADQFLDFIGAIAEGVKVGRLTEADGRLAISTYATQASAQIQADQQATLQQTECALLASGGPDTTEAREAAAMCPGISAPTAPSAPAAAPSLAPPMPLGGPQVIQGIQNRVCLYHLSGGQEVTRTLGPYTPCPSSP